MIEIRKNTNVDLVDDYQLFVDSSPVSNVRVGARPTYNSGILIFDIATRDYEASKKLITYSLSEFTAAHVFTGPFSIDYLQLKYKLDWFDFITGVLLDIHNKDEQHYEIYFEFGGLVSWHGSYSFSEYYQELSNVVEAADTQEILVAPRDKEDTIFDYLAVMFPGRPDAPIINEISRCSDILQAFNREAIKALAFRHPETSIVMSFDFPEEVRVPCEQYLIYFVQFLKDLGVEATAELQHDAGQVLFAVTPTNKDEALDKIRAALETYLQLPSNPGVDSTNFEQGVAIQRLAANIDHLKGQLRLAHAELRLAGATIQTQQVTINHLLSGEVIIESLKDVTPKPKDEDKEEVLGGILAVTQYKDKGVELNLAEIFRRLKRLFKDEE